MNQKLIADLVIKKYDESSISNAKSLLQEKCVGGPQELLRLRRGENKKIKDVEDIIAFAAVCPTENRPRFVVGDLRKLPQISFDYVDVSVVLQELLQVKTKMVEMEEEMSVMKIAINDNMMTCQQPKTPQESHGNKNNRKQEISSYQDALTQEDNQEENYGNEDSRRIPNSSDVIAETTEGINSDEHSQDEASNVDNDDRPRNRWQRVTSRNTKRKARQSTSVPQTFEGNGEDGPLTVKRRYNVNIFLSRIAPQVSNSEVEEYITGKMPTGWYAKCIQLVSKYNTYKSYHVQISAEDKDVVKKAFDCNFWPKGAFVKRYF